MGQVLRGRWQLVRLIGRGGMAAVYEGRHRNGDPVAIKVLHGHVSLPPLQRARFQREGYAANRVGHPGVARVFDDDVTEDGCPFMVMELLHGRTAAEKAAAQGGRLGAGEVADLGRRALEVLVSAHRHGVLHRDLKPENLFLADDGTLRVLDFGIARVADATDEVRQTQPGTLLGTPAFMAPEQARGHVEAVDARTDVWGIGATLFTLLTGRLVHVASTSNEQLALAMSTPALPIRKVAPETPRRLAAVIDRALAFDPADRFSDAQTMLTALAAASAGETNEGRSARLRRTGLFVAGAIAALAGATALLRPGAVVKGSRTATPLGSAANAALPSLTAPVPQQSLKADAVKAISVETATRSVPVRSIVTAASAAKRRSSPAVPAAKPEGEPAPSPPKKNVWDRRH